MRHTHIAPVALAPGDTLALTHNVDLQNGGGETATLVGWRWEPVFTTDTPAELAALLEAAAVDAVSA